MSKKVIDFGCGPNKEQGSIGVDNVALSNVDIVHDLTDYPYPFEDSCASDIYLKHVVEHFPLEEINNILKEVHRILEPGGFLHVRVPHVFSVAAWSDPTHRMSFTFGSIGFFVTDTAKSYYKETDSIWQLDSITTRVTWFNWKSYRLRQIDSLLSRMLARIINWLLKRKSFPGSADLLIKILPIFFVEIRWILRKV